MDAWKKTWLRIAEDFKCAMGTRGVAAGMGILTQESEIFVKLKTILASSTRRMVKGQVQDGEDALQIVFNNMVEHPSSAPLDGIGFRKWVYVIRKNVCRDFLRRKRPTEPIPYVHPAAPGAGVVTKVHRAEEKIRWRDRIDALPAPLCEVARLRYIEGVGPDEIALRLEASTRVIRRHLQRALQRLGRHIRRDRAMEA